MPIYEYLCPKCGAVAEFQRTIEERDGPIRCRECNINARRIPSVFNIAQRATARRASESNETRDSGTTTKHPACVGIRIGEDDHLTLQGCQFEGLGVGVSVGQRAKIQVSDTTFRNVLIPFEVRDKSRSRPV